MSREIKFTQHMQKRMKALIEDMGLTRYLKSHSPTAGKIHFKHSSGGLDNQVGATILAETLERVRIEVALHGVTTFYIRVCRPLRIHSTLVLFEVLINLYK